MQDNLIAALFSSGEKTALPLAVHSAAPAPEVTKSDAFQKVILNHSLNPVNISTQSCNLN